MQPFICAAFLPACNRNGDAIPPCRDLCLATKANCQVSMEDLGLEWPSELDCDVFPTIDENPRCISGHTEDNLPARVNPRVVIRTSDSITVEWKKLKPNLIQGYMLGYGNGEPDIMIERLPATQSEFTITGLTPDTSYQIMLRAYNLVGEGEVTVVNAVTKPSSDDGSDESEEMCSQPMPTCPDDAIACDDDSKCVSMSAVCDRIPDCDDGRDEMHCEGETAIRLSNGTSPSEGLLEVFYNNEWGTVCDEGWDFEDSEVVCRQLGYNRTKFAISVELSHYVGFDSFRSVMFTNVDCEGTEESLFDCPKSDWYVDDFSSACTSHLNDVIVACQKEEWPTEEGAVRLVSSLYDVPHSGLVQYYKDGQWGYLCTPLVWDEGNADVVCRQLGFGPALFKAALGQMFGTGDGVGYASVSSCTGEEATLAECPLIPWAIGDECKHHMDIGVICDTGSRKTAIRLSKEQSPNEGVLEVFYNNEWGTVCDEGWDVKDSEVVCRQLGYKGVKYWRSSPQLWYNLHFDRFISVMFKNVDCEGTEESLFDCPKSDWYDFDDFSCTGHSGDVVLGCTKEDIDLQLRDLNVVETGSGIDVHMTCSREDLLMYVDAAEAPVWTLPSGTKLSVRYRAGNVECSQIGFGVVGSIMLTITGFTDERNAGVYLCTAAGYQKNVTLTEATLAVSVEFPCAEDEFNCGERCVPQRFLCDQDQDCVDGRDELEEVCSQPMPTCPDDEIACDGDSKCVSMSAVCDRIPDCDDGTDEMNCEAAVTPGPFPPSSCPDGLIPCPTSDQCIPPSAMCDGNPDCNDGIDEMACDEGGAGVNNCPDGKFPCPGEDKCISISDACNGVNDCATGVDEMNCNATSCVPISIPECAVGLDYTETMSTHNTGLSPEDVANVFSSLSTIFESGCATFFRPFMCSTFAPPCGHVPLPPCRELCEVSVRRCLETFEGTMTEEQLMPQGGFGGAGCDVFPSQDDGQCYNVKEVSVGEVAGLGSEEGVGVSVDCTYNLLPGIQPKWTTPDGSKVKTGDTRTIRAVYVSDTVTRLQIDNLQSRRKGVYTCSGREYSVTVEL
ncbi:uncharacterized protein LOC119740235 isoform X2 [Patiria miniata]|uniref:Uncharacterized protein n=1 Tax=Patiria miniata TaxID=46514 RepID=A0A914B5N5_PATMI|nr:uncharacterized protein LOC119740235 isoform X2 [Patiria miniata]